MSSEQITGNEHYKVVFEVAGIEFEQSTYFKTASLTKKVVDYLEKTSCIQVTNVRVKKE